MPRKIAIVSCACLASLAVTVSASAQSSASETQPAEPEQPSQPPAAMPATPTPTEPVWVGPVAAPAVRSSTPIPAPPPEGYTTNLQVAACPNGACGQMRPPRAPHPQPVDPGRKHRGFLVRVTTGWGVGPLVGTRRDVEETSLALGVAVDAGAAVVENLIVRARLRASVLGFHDSDFGHDVSFSYGAAGLGADYYFMPLNLYVGGTVSLAGIARTHDDNVLHSKAGIGLELDVGKEWWLGSHWGVGLAARGSFVDVQAANIEGGGHLRSLHIGLQFSATYN